MRIGSLLFVCAMALSATAAYYSIVGLAMIFSGAYVAVIIMAAILEVSKLVITSWLYQKWNEASTWLRSYLTASVVVLMMITSLGIFGFLSKAHVDQGLQNGEVTLRIEQLDRQIGSINELVTRYRTQLEQLDRSINIQLDRNLAAQALAARNRQTAERDQIRQKLDTEQSRIVDLQQQRSQLQQQMNVLDSKIGPIRYVAELFVSDGHVNTEDTVRWMIIVLVLVFDPLAVLMLIAANMSLGRSTPVHSPVAVLPPDQPLPSEVVPTRPLGDVLCVEGRPMRWWSGATWERFDDPATNVDRRLDELAVRMQEITDRIQPPPTMSEISSLVKSSMDDWLSQISSSDTLPASTVDLQADDVQIEESPAPETNENDIPQTMETSESRRVDDLPSQHTNPRPTWL
jgi:uncharacterized phage infection (PIP) family protein YhgE